MAEVLAIVGPTASGKTSLAVALATILDGEVVGTDSMQAYRGMDIGTATPTSHEQAGIRHHMIDCWEPSREVSVAEFQAAARECIADILERSRTPIVTGGSGLYVSAVLDDLRFPGTDPVVRSRLEEQAAVLGGPAMHTLLAEVDPVAADAILPENTRRIVRALEVNEITGSPFIARLPVPTEVFETRRIGIEIPRDILDERIAARVDSMIEAGLLDEVAELHAGGHLGRTAGAALGYPQFAGVHRGEATLEQARDETIAATRKFARRQQRWFRRDSRIEWIDYDDVGAVSAIAAGWRGTSQ